MGWYQRRVHGDSSHFWVRFRLSNSLFLFLWELRIDQFWNQFRIDKFDFFILKQQHQQNRPPNKQILHWRATARLSEKMSNQTKSNSEFAEYEWMMEEGADEKLQREVEEELKMAELERLMMQEEKESGDLQVHTTNLLDLLFRFLVWVIYLETNDLSMICSLWGVCLSLGIRIGHSSQGDRKMRRFPT